jgi:hypothetical protein
MDARRNRHRSVILARLGRKSLSPGADPLDDGAVSPTAFCLRLSASGPRRGSPGWEAETMRWSLRLRAAEKGIWKSTRHAAAAGRRRSGDQFGQDVGAVDRDPDDGSGSMTWTSSARSWTAVRPSC